MLPDSAVMTSCKCNAAAFFTVSSFQKMSHDSGFLLQFTSHKLSALHSSYAQSAIQNATSKLQAAVKVCLTSQRAESKPEL